MRKLFIDDIRTAPDDSWNTVRTVTEAIRAIARYDWDVISLDHDISHQVTVGDLSRPYPCGETFAAVAYYIATKYEYRRMSYSEFSTDEWNPKIILHTSNQVAGDEMEKILKESGIECEKRYMGAASRV